MAQIKQSAVKPSTRKDKKFMRMVEKIEDGETVKKKTVHFGDPKLSIKKNQPERKANYCARSGGIKGKDDPFSANYQSRKMWECNDKG